MHPDSSSTTTFSSSPMDHHMNPNFPPDHHHQEQHLKCPRCESNNTKFCYYNNYNLSQPRHFCKNCRRYWTKGGTLRNIPIGGGTRKITKRSSNHNKRTSPAVAVAPPPAPPLISTDQRPKSEPSSSVVYGFGNNNNQQMEGENGGGSSFSSLIGSNSMGAFGDLLMDGLRSNLVSKSGDDDDVLIRNPVAISDEFRSSFLRLNDNKNENEKEKSGNGNGESSCWNGGENVWPDLSIFTPGSSFH